jgi:hypothetical protein
MLRVPELTKEDRIVIARFLNCELNSEDELDFLTEVRDSGFYIMDQPQVDSLICGLVKDIVDKGVYDITYMNLLGQVAE